MKYFFLLLFPTLALSASATTWNVGAAQVYTMPSQVSTLVQNGDTVNIDAGIYALDVAKWTAHDLVLRGVGGIAQLPSGGLVYGGKAIWVIAGDNALVENIAFSEATCVDQNGAGIRQEGHHLTVRNCKFMGNQMGILAGDLSPSHILIENSEFANNGAGDGFSHNVYINHVDTLTFRYNYSHGAWVGHDLKSRAHVNFILYNRISDEQGEASRCIDLPNGGITYLVGNAIEQGPNSPNQDVIGYGLEGLSNPTPHELYAVNNTLVSNRSNAIYFHLAPPMTFFKAYNNILAGPASDPYSGLPTAIDTASNVFLSTTAAFHFADASNYNYQLTENSTLVLNNAMDPGFANGFSLSATLQYVHPTSMQPRCVPGTPDIGAFEWCEPGLGVEMSNPEFAFFPNPTSRFVYFKAPVRRLTIVNAAGNVEFERNNVSSLDLVNFQSGIYFLTTSNGTYPVMLFR